MTTGKSDLQVIEYPSVNFNERPSDSKVDCIVLHYTDFATIAETLERLTDPKFEVSSHYVIDDDGTIYRLVEDEKRAWHAGPSSWLGRDNVNHFSIGIELQNGGYYAGYALTGEWPEFPEPQIDSLKRLLKHLMTKFGVDPQMIIGHSDVAPDRKIDPGPAFPWDALQELGVSRQAISVNESKLLQQHLAEYNQKTD